ncbi:MAG: aldo/keto reductase, partial [Candidatus Competibacteraceae bacterium]
MSHRHSRRTALKILGAGIAAAWLTPHRSLARSGALLRKSIPGGGQLPVIGLGTWRTFNVGSDPQLLDARTEVVR